MLQSMCSTEVSFDEFLNKCIQGRIFYHFDGEGVENFYFPIGLSTDRLIPIILKLFNNAGKCYHTPSDIPAKFFLNNYSFRRYIFKESLKNNHPMFDRLILKLLKILNIGRATIDGQKIYLRKYDLKDIGYTPGIDFKKYTLGNNFPIKTRFVYN